MSQPPFELDFYEDELGDRPVRRWLREELAPRQRRALGFAMKEVLQYRGISVCGTEFGKQLGGGLFEFRLKRDLSGIPNSQSSTSRTQELDRILLRIFCHAHGTKVILLLAGYDKGKEPSKKRQQAEIELARKRLADWQRRERIRPPR